MCIIVYLQLVEYMTLTARINKYAYSFGQTCSSRDMLINNYYTQRHIILYNLINYLTIVDYHW